MILFSSQISCQWEVKSTKLHIVKIKKMSTVQRPTRSRSLTSAWKPNKKMSAPPGRRSFSCGAKQNIPSACVHTKPFLQQISTKISWSYTSNFSFNKFQPKYPGVQVIPFLQRISTKISWVFTSNFSFAQLSKVVVSFFPSKFSLWQSLSADVDVCPCEIVGLIEEISKSQNLTQLSKVVIFVIWLSAGCVRLWGWDGWRRSDNAS